MMGSGNMGMAYGAPRMFARTDVGAKEPLPLAPDHFGKVRLTGATAREYEAVALALVNDAVDKSRKERIYGGADESWRDVGATNGFKRYTKLEGAVQHYRIQGVVCAPMANVMSMLYAERNASMVARRSVFYGNGLDAQNLKTLRERTIADRHQHMALRWEAFNISTATVNFKFDASFLEYTGITLDQDREPVGFKMTHSVEVPECKPLLKSHGLRRMDTTEVMILRPSANSSYTEITIEGSFEVADKLSSTVVGTYLTQITHQLTKVPTEIQAHRLGAMKVLDKSQWVPAGERKNCSVCLSRFGMMGKKHHCRACGEVVCKSCVVTRPHRDDEKFCKKCVVVACAEDELVIPDRHNPLSTPSSSSTSSRHREPTRDVVRDSYVMQMHRFSDQDPLSASVYSPQVFVPQQQQPTRPALQQQQYQPQYQQQYSANHPQAMPHQYRTDKMIGLEELKHVRDDNHSMTASETSYGSTYSNSGMFSDNMGSQTYDGNDGYYRSEPEDSMIYLDTKSMQRAAASAPAASTNSDSAMHGMGRGYSARTPVQPPMMQHVESSLAQQRDLLNKMMYQASQANHQSSRAGYRQYPVSSDF